MGKGGFGKVNVVMKKGTDKLFAMKRMEKAKVIQKQSHVRLVWTEREIMSKVSSPFLVHLEHSFQDAAELFFIMPFMRGGDLRYHLRQKRVLREDEARFYACEIMLGLEELHRMNIIYRDLKPDNVLLDLEGHARLSDFGVSVQVSARERFSVKGKRAGTPGYMSPEMLAGHRYGAPSDVWSYGATLYELLHGCRPYHHKFPYAQQKLRLSSSLSPECGQLLRRLLELDPAQRLGGSVVGIGELRRHAWFRGINWDEVRARSNPGPIVPDPVHANCIGDYELEEHFLDQKPVPIDAEADKVFHGFDFRTEIVADQNEHTMIRSKLRIPSDATPTTTELSAANGDDSKTGGQPQDDDFKTKVRRSSTSRSAGGVFPSLEVKKRLPTDNVRSWTKPVRANGAKRDFRVVQVMPAPPSAP